MPVKIVPKKGGPKNFTRKSMKKKTPAAKKVGGSMKKKGYAMGGAMKKKGMKKGGKLKMVTNDQGQKVPFFAADGKGKMKGGGMMKKKGYAMGGSMKKKGMKKGGMMKKGYAKGGSVKVKSGDTLSQIAKSKGVTLKALMAANPNIKNANMIRVGQSIKMPTAAGTKSSSPYAGMTKSQMAALRDDTAAKRAKKSKKPAPKAKTAQSPDAASKRARVATRLSNLGEITRQRRQADAAAPKPASKPKSSIPGITAKKVKPGITAKKTTSVTPPVPKPFKPEKVSRRAGRKAGGGMMKKKGMSKGGVARGTGAATRGKRFGRAG